MKTGDERALTTTQLWLLPQTDQSSAVFQLHLLVLDHCVRYLKRGVMIKKTLQCVSH